VQTILTNPVNCWKPKSFRIWQSASKSTIKLRSTLWEGSETKGEAALPIKPYERRTPFLGDDIVQAL
jgi:hypothetical protein